MLLSVVGESRIQRMGLTITHFFDGFAPTVLLWTTGNAISQIDDGEKFCLMDGSYAQ